MRPRITTVKPLGEALREAFAKRGVRLVEIRRDDRWDVGLSVQWGPAAYGGLSAYTRPEPNDTLEAIDDRLFDEAVRLLDEVLARRKNGEPC